MLTMPLSPIPAAVPDLGSTVMIASLDPFAIVLLATLAAACLGLVWRAAHSGHRSAQPRRRHQIRPVRQTA
jgi:hypothetical protein